MAWDSRGKNRVVLVTPHSPFSPIYCFPRFQFPFPFWTSQPMVYNPISFQIPLGVAYVAASLEEAEIDVKIVDLTFVNKQQYNVNEVKKRVLDLEPDVVGISSLTSTITDAYKLTHAIKEKKPTVMTVIGGPHVSALPKRTLEECSSIDAVIIGDGEHTFRAFLEHVFSKGIGNELTNLSGLMFRYDDKLLGDPRPAYIDNLDSLPFPARHLFNLNNYLKLSNSTPAKEHPVASISTSRGCPYSCLFCTKSTSGNRFRSRSPKNVVLEIKQLKEQGFNEIRIVEDNFTFDRNRVIEICKQIKKNKINMSFCLPNGIRVDSVDEALLSTMYDAGFYSIHFGVESGDDTVLKSIRKDITVNQIKKAVHTAKKIGFYVALFTIVGLPGSSVKSEEKTRQLVEESEADVAFPSVCVPYPGSRLWDMVKDRPQRVPWERYKESALSNPIYVPNGMTQHQIQRCLNKLKNSKKFIVPGF